MSFSRGRSISKLLGIAAGLALLMAAVLGAFRTSAVRAATTSTTWTKVMSNCAAPPPGAPSGNWVQEGNACWDQNVSYGGWTVNDGSASEMHTSPTFTISMTFPVPGSIGSSAAQASLGVSVTGGIAQRICVLQAYTSFTVAGGDACATTSASMQSATATASIQPMDAADGSLAYVWISLGDGGNLFYTYKASTPTPTCSPPPGLGLHIAGHAATCRNYTVRLDVHVDAFPDSPPDKDLNNRNLANVEIRSDGTKLVWDPEKMVWLGEGELELTTTYINPIGPLHLHEHHATLSFGAAADGFGGGPPAYASYSQSPTRRLVHVPAVVTNSSGEDCDFDTRLLVTLGLAKGKKAALKIASTSGSCLSSSPLIWRTDRIKSAHIHPPV